MTTSLTPSSISAIPDDGKPTEVQTAYFGRRLRRDLHGLVLNCFIEEQRDNKLTKAELARRMDRDPASVTRWLGAPKNHTMETISALLLAMGYVPRVTALKLSEIGPSNEFHELVEGGPDLTFIAPSGVATVEIKGHATLSGSGTSRLRLTPSTSTTTSSITTKELVRG